MIEVRQRAGSVDPRAIIDTLIAQHGAWRVLRTALFAAFRGDGRGRVTNTRHLSDRLRRDIGLDPLPPERAHWDLR